MCGELSTTQAALLGALTVVFFAFACGDTAPPPSVVATAPPSSPPASAPANGPENASSPTAIDASAPDTNAPFRKPSECFKDFTGPIVGPNYDQFSPAMGNHCAGTQQQKVDKVEKLVFLGDSITAGTPPNLPNQYYRQLVEAGIKKRFGDDVEVADCSRWGARDWDLMGKPNTNQKGQIKQCFGSGLETKKTLVVMTMGGNDINAWAGDQLAAPAAMIEAETSANQVGEALAWLKDPAHFPNGSWVVFGNVYEFTDTSGDLHSCPAASLTGMKPSYAQGTPAIVRLQELYMKHAVETGSDMVFLLENFCGHGYRRDDPLLQCYRGPNAELWFDLTCIHPNPIGHAKIAEYVLQIVDG